MGNPRKFRAAMPNAVPAVKPLAGPAPIVPPVKTRSHPAGMLKRYNEQGPIPAAKGVKPATSRKRRM